MTEKFKILAKYIKDVSSETPNVETYIFVKDRISKYQLNIEINSAPLKNKMIEVNTTLKFEDPEDNEKKSYFEMIYSTVVRINDEIREKKDLEKIVLCDVPTIIYPDLEKAFMDLVHNSGHQEIKFEKKINFLELYNQKFN